MQKFCFEKRGKTKLGKKEKLPTPRLCCTAAVAALRSHLRRDAPQRPLHLSPVPHHLNVRVFPYARRGFRPRVGPLPVVQQHPHPRVGALGGVAGVVVDQDRGPDRAAELRLARRLPFQGPVVAKVDSGVEEGEAEVGVQPVERGLADHVLPRGHDGKRGAKVAGVAEGFGGAGDGLDAVGEVAGVEEGVDNLVGGVAGAAPDLFVKGERESFFLPFLSEWFFSFSGFFFLVLLSSSNALSSFPSF